MESFVIKDDYCIDHVNIEENISDGKFLNSFIMMDNYNNNDNNEHITLYAQQQIIRDRSQLQIMLSIKDNIVDIILKDPTYRMPIKLYNDITAVKQNVMDIVRNNPSYSLMQTNINKTLQMYDFVSLVVAIGTLNPIHIIYGLYKLGKNL